MDEYLATELAYKHGFEAGKASRARSLWWYDDDNLKLICKRCHADAVGGICLVECYEVKGISRKFRYCPGCGAKMEGMIYERF